MERGAAHAEWVGDVLVRASAEAVDAEGWLHTGDAGYLEDNGHLVVIDRQKDVLTTADGTRFSSAFIENKLKFSPYVELSLIHI